MSHFGTKIGPELELPREVATRGRQDEKKGPTDQGKTLMEHEPNQGQEYEARDGRALAPSPGRLPLPPPRQETPGKARHRSAEIQNGHFRPWMLLASTQELPKGDNTVR